MGCCGCGTDSLPPARPGDTLPMDTPCSGTARLPAEETNAVDEELETSVAMTTTTTVSSSPTTEGATTTEGSFEEGRRSTGGRAQQQHPDGMREIRAMVVASLPCPPMPVMVSRELEDEASFTSIDASCCSSHDIMAHLMNLACTVATEDHNRRRAELQHEAMTELFDAVDEWIGAQTTGSRARLPPVKWSYDLFATFTRRYIQSFMPDPTRTQDIRMLPIESIDRTHRVHAKALQFQRAQDILYGEECKQQFRCLLRCSYEAMSYAELVQLSMARIIHAKPI